MTPMTPLRLRMTEDMQVRNLSVHTQTSYVQQVSLFARHFDKSPMELGPEEIRSYQVYLTNERKLAPGPKLTLDQMFFEAELQLLEMIIEDEGNWLPAGCYQRGPTVGWRPH